MMFHVPQEHQDAELLAERIVPRLQHANAAVVLTSVKVILYLMNYMDNEEVVNNLFKKLAPPMGIIFKYFSKFLLSIINTDLTFLLENKNSYFITQWL